MFALSCRRVGPAATGFLKNCRGFAVAEALPDPVGGGEDILAPEPHIFLHGVEFDAEVVKWIPVSDFTECGQEHYFIRQIFVDAAASGQWQEHGIPPVWGYSIGNGMWKHWMAYGQTRLNSAREVERHALVPVWDISRAIINGNVLSLDRLSLLPHWNALGIDDSKLVRDVFYRDHPDFGSQMMKRWTI